MKIFKVLALSSILLVAGCAAQVKEQSQTAVESKMKLTDVLVLHEKRMESLKSYSSNVLVKTVTKEAEKEKTSNVDMKIDLHVNPLKGRIKLNVDLNDTKIEGSEIYFDKDHTYTKLNEKWVKGAAEQSNVRIEDLTVNKQIKELMKEHYKWFKVETKGDNYLVTLKEKGAKQFEDLVEHLPQLSSLGKKGEVGEFFIEFAKTGEPVELSMKLKSEELNTTFEMGSKFSNFDKVEAFELPKVE